MNIKKRFSDIQSTLSGQLSKGFDTALDKVDLQRTPRIGAKLLFTALGLGVGLMVGVGATLLLAPMTGKQLRAKLMGGTKKHEVAGALEDKNELDDKASSNRLSSHARRSLATPSLAAPNLASTS